MGSLSGLFDVLQGALAFAIILPILIAVHELGHFWVARAFGMEVDAFAIFVGGVRKTKLEPLLPKPLAPTWIVWAAGLASTALLVLGGSGQNVVLTVLGLVLAGIAVPVWIVTRIGALYHLALSESLGTLLKTWLAAGGLFLFANRFQVGNPLPLLGLIAISSLIGILFVYYNPVMHKAEDAPNGHGQIEVQQGLSSKNLSSRESGEFFDAHGVSNSRVPVLFRPLLYRTDRRGTEFSLLCWPLGGFAAIKGMHPKEDGSETKIPGGFYSKSPFARLLVLFAGPLFSIVFGVGVLTQQLIVTGEKVPSNAPVIGSVVADGPGAKAGLKPGDRFVSVNDQPIETFFDAVKAIRNSTQVVDKEVVGAPLKLVVNRQGQDLSFTVTPAVDKSPSAVMGPGMKDTGKTAIQAKLQMGPELQSVPVSFNRAIGMAASLPLDMVSGLASTFAKPSELSKNVGGPAMIAQQISEASKRGLSDTIMMAGGLSISLGVMNLLPIGPLDGGQMMVALAEMFRRGKRLSYKLQMTISTVGALLVVALILGVVTLDIGRFGGR